MTLDYAVQTYGYWAVAAGCAVDLPAVLALAGYAAQRGYLRLELVLPIAFACAFAGDQTFYWLGRWQGPRLLENRPVWRARVERVQAALGRAAIPLMIGFRFFYGLRVTTPVAVGLSGIPVRRFAPLNLLGSAIWAPVVTLFGYFFGPRIQDLLGGVNKVQMVFLAAVAALALAIVLVRRRRKRIT